MNRPLLDQFDRIRFTEARRLFAVRQMLDGIETGDYPHFAERCRQMIDTDHCLLRRRLQPRPLRDGPHFATSPPCLDSLSERRRRAHKQFVALLEFVLTTFSPSVARRLMAPAVRQLRRLQSFDDRVPNRNQECRSEGDDDGSRLKNASLHASLVESRPV